MMMGSRFKAGPLSIAVPEGAFNKWVDEEVTRVQSRRQAGQPGTSSGGSFNWPKLNALTINDLTSKGREWVDFLGLKSGLQNSYGVTRNTLDIRKRMDENAARYIVNYTRSTMVLVCCLLCERPESVVGIVVVLAIVEWFSQFTARTNLDKQSTLYQILSILVTLVVWGVVLLSKAMASVSRAMVLVGIVTLAHACLRLPEAEERRKLKEANRRLRQIKR